MCGICGFVGGGKYEDLKKMNRQMVLRGPDAEGYWQSKGKGVYLAHRRLSIVDLEGGHQPMFTNDGSFGIVFNGEIYNHRQLRQILESRGHIFTSNHSDTEVLLHGYREWGKALPEKLNGMWAFAIYNLKHNEIFISKDRFGKKPLYFTMQNNTFVFASELKAVTLHSSISAKTSTQSLVKYFAYGFIPSPLSIYKGIYKLPGGHNLTLSCDDLTYSISRYWKFKIEPFSKLPERPLEAWGEELRFLLKKAVKRRMESDVPLGVFLSGGIDSSSITYFAAQLSSTEPIRSFSIGFNENSFDESEKASRVANLMQTRHACESFTLENLLELTRDISNHLDEPLGDSSLLPTYLLCKGTRKHVSVALGGDGADELFAGYDPFKALAPANLYHRLVPHTMHKALRFLTGFLPVSHRNMSMDFKIKRTLLGLSYPKKLWHPVWLGPLDPAELGSLFGRNLDVDGIYSEAISSWENCEQDNMIDKATQFFVDLYLQDGILTKVDRASMMNSLEVRVPYLDIDFVNFARKIPARYRIKNGKTKFILKSTLEKILPAQVIHQRKKGFGIPIGRWFHSGDLSFTNKQINAFPSPSYLKRKLRLHQMGKCDNRLFLWNAWLLSKYMTSR